MRYVFLLFLVVSFVATNSDAAIYHVKKTGSDSHTCTQAQQESTPRLTMNAGADCLSGGDTLRVYAGTYNERMSTSGTTNIPSGTTGSPTIIECAVSRTCIVQYDGQPMSFLIFQRHWVTVRGFVIDAVNQPSNASHAIGTDGLSHSSTTNIVFEDIEAKRAWRTGFRVKGSNITIRDSWIHDNGRSLTSGSGIYAQTQGALFERNLIESNLNGGISGVDPAEGVTLTGAEARRNIIRNNGNYAFATRNTIFNAGGGIHNNVIYGNGTQPSQWPVILVQGGGNHVYNNTVYNNDGTFVQIAFGSTSIVRNNIGWQNTTNSIVDNVGGNTISNNLLTDPSFVDAPNANFRLRAGSAAIDAGVSIPAIITDFAGNSRPQGFAYDIGTYEYVATGSSPAAPTVLQVGSAQ